MTEDIFQSVNVCDYAVSNKRYCSQGDHAHKKTLNIYANLKLLQHQ